MNCIVELLSLHIPGSHTWVKKEENHWEHIHRETTRCAEAYTIRVEDVTCRCRGSWLTVPWLPPDIWRLTACLTLTGCSMLVTRVSLVAKAKYPTVVSLAPSTYTLGSSHCV